VATLSHAAGGAGLPPLLNVVVALVLAMPVCVLLAGSRLSWLRLSIAVAASQLLFHGLLSVPLVPTGATVSSHHAMASVSLGSTTSALPADHLAMDSSMWAAHAVAAVITIVLLGWGELAVAAIAHVLGLSGLVALRTFSPLRPAPVLPAPGRAPRVPAGREQFSVVRWRGPPVAC
jgi:hypothetical protein